MALIDEVKTYIRVSIDDSDINMEVQTLIDASIADLTKTADVSSNHFEGESIDSLLKLAVFVYVRAYWTDNEDERAKLLNRYDEIKTKLVLSSNYNGLSEVV